MNPNRSTNEFTPLAYLNWIQRGSTADWRRLYELCRDPAIARTVASMLSMRDPDLLPSARLWKFLLEDLHPELQIDLRLDRHDQASSQHNPLDQNESFWSSDGVV